MTVTLHPHVCEVCGKEFSTHKRRQRTCGWACRGRLAGTAPSTLTCQCGAPAGKKGRCHTCSLEHKRQGRRDFYHRHRERILEQRRLEFQTNQTVREKIKQRGVNRRFNGLRDKRMALDEYKCRECGTKEQLVVHHKRGHDRRARDHASTIKDLVTLCRACHIKVHHRMGDFRRASKTPRDGSGASVV